MNGIQLPTIAGETATARVGDWVVITSVGDSFTPIRPGSLARVSAVADLSLTVLAGPYYTPTEHVLFPGLDQVVLIGSPYRPAWPQTKVHSGTNELWSLRDQVRTSLDESGRGDLGEQVGDWVRSLYNTTRSWEVPRELLCSIVSLSWYQPEPYDYEKAARNHEREQALGY